MPSVPSKEVGRGPGTKRPRDGSTAVPAEGQVVNKSQFIDELASRYDGNRKAAAHALDSVLDTITRQVAKGEKVAITGFGSFEKAVRNARWVRNPQTGARVKTKKKSVPKFSAGADLKNVVSGAKKLPAVKKAAAPAKKAAAPAKAAAKKATATPRRRVDGEEDHSQEGTGQEGACEEGSGQEGSCEEGSREEGTGQEGTCQEGSCEEGAREEGTGQEGAREEGTCEEGAREEGTCQEGAGEEGCSQEVVADVYPRRAVLIMRAARRRLPRAKRRGRPASPGRRRAPLPPAG